MMNKKELIKLALKQRCRFPGNGLTSWKRMYYTCKAVIYIIKDKQAPDDIDTFMETKYDPIAVASFNMQSHTYLDQHGDSHHAEDWEELTLFRDLPYFDIISQGYP